MLLSINHQNYFASIDGEDSFNVKVYPVWEISETQFHFQSEKDGTGIEDRELADWLFEFSFCYRGVWEERIFFKPGREYDCDELRDMPEIYNKLEPILKEKIKAKNPNFLYDE